MSCSSTILLCLNFYGFIATKKGGQTNVNAAAPSGIASSYKSGPIQVFLNGKIVTPQSLIPRKTATGHYGKKPKTNVIKPQTIDENSSENAEKPLTNTFQSKLNLKRFRMSFSSLFPCLTFSLSSLFLYC
jgi:hypothetical protein